MKRRARFRSIGATELAVSTVRAFRGPIALDTDEPSGPSSHPRYPVAPEKMPPRRIDGLEVNPVEDGFMIYQSDKDRVHYLNHTAVLVLELCDGRRSATAIAELVKKAYGLPKLPRKEVDETLAKMTSEGLVETKRVNRRAARTPMRRAGRRRT